MGILNVTPDSFSDGGLYSRAEDAIAQAKRMLLEGADMLDVGGESTRPGAAKVSVQEELDRVCPVIEVLHKTFPHVPISIDTSKPEVMQAAVSLGATMINDTRALTLPGALEMAAELKVPVCLMHMQGSPQTMQKAPDYHNTVHEVYDFLKARVEACENIGISRADVILDPGFGFGKRLQHNLQLLKHLDYFASLELPLLIGVSRKSMFGDLLNADVNERLYGSLAAAVIAATKGAKIIRVHDVKATQDAMRVFEAVQDEATDSLDEVPCKGENQ